MNGGPPRATGRIVAGAMLILLGVVFTLDNFGLIDAGDLFRFWPVLLLGAGVVRILDSRDPSQRTAGFVLTGLGLFFLLRNLGVFWLRFHDVWPVLLLLLGGSILWRAARSRSGAPPAPSGGTPPDGPGERALAGARAGLAATRTLHGGPVPVGDTLNEFALMGGGERVVQSQDFRGGEVTAILGGFDIDLRGAGIAGDSATLEVFTLWGGVDLKIPQDWNVVVSGVPILGTISSSARTVRDGATPGKTLYIKGTAIMGGVEIKN